MIIRHGKVAAVVLHLAVGAAVVTAFSSLRDLGRHHSPTLHDSKRPRRMSWNSENNYDRNKHSYGDARSPLGDDTSNRVQGSEARNRLENAIKRRQQLQVKENSNKLEYLESLTPPSEQQQQAAPPVQDDQGIYQIKTKEQHA